MFSQEQQKALAELTASTDKLTDEAMEKYNKLLNIERESINPKESLRKMYNRIYHELTTTYPMDALIPLFPPGFMWKKFEPKHKTHAINIKFNGETKQCMVPPYASLEVLEFIYKTPGQEQTYYFDGQGDPLCKYTRFIELAVEQPNFDALSIKVE